MDMSQITRAMVVSFRGGPGGRFGVLPTRRTTGAHFDTVPEEISPGHRGEASRQPADRLPQLRRVEQLCLETQSGHVHREPFQVVPADEEPAPTVAILLDTTDLRRDQLPHEG